MSEKQPSLIYLQEALELLGISRSTLDRWRQQKGLPYIKIGKEVLFDRDELLRWRYSYERTIEPLQMKAAALQTQSRTADRQSASALPSGSACSVINVGYQSETAHMWTPLLMRLLGYFEEELQELQSFGKTYAVNWTDAASGLELVEGMIAGRVQIASLGDYPIVVSQQLSGLLPHYQATLLAYDGKTKGGLGIALVVPESNRFIRDLSGLDAAAVSTVPNSSAGCRLRRLLAWSERAPSEPKHARAMSECLRGLVDRSVGAAVMWEPYVSLAETIGAGRQIADEIESDDYLTGVVALNDWVRANEDAAVAYLKAHIRTHRFIRDNAYRAAQLINNEIGLPVQVAHRVISRVRWDAIPYACDLHTLERLAVAEGALPLRTNARNFSVEPSYLMYAAGALRLPPISSSSLSDDWSREPW